MGMQKQLPPHNIEAEQQLLGALLTNNDLYHKVSDTITFETFFDPVHSRIFEVIESKIQAQQVASPVTLKPSFENDEGIKELGGVGYLIRLLGASVSAFAISDYAEMINDLYIKRALIADMKDAMSVIADGRTPASTVALDLENSSGTLATKSRKTTIMEPFKHSMTRAIQNIAETFQSGTVQGTRTGIPELDKIIGSMFPEDSIILAGRPGMGKSAVAQAIGLNVAMAGFGVFDANVEMSNDQKMHRAISGILARKGITIEYNRIRNNQITHEELKQIVVAAKEYEHLPIESVGKEAKDLQVLKSTAKSAARKFKDRGIKMGLAVVDYLQLVKSRTARTEMEHINDVSLASKDLAQELGIPVLMLSQLNRQVETREIPIPTLADLRGSGNIEQDADTVIFVYRPEYYVQKELETCRGDHDKRVLVEAELAEVKNRVSLIVEKQRMGPPKAAVCDMHIAYNHVGSLTDGLQADFAV